MGRSVNLRDSLGCGGNTGGACGYLRSGCPADRKRSERTFGGDGTQPRRLLRAVSVPSCCESRGQVGARLGGAGRIIEAGGRCFKGR